MVVYSHSRLSTFEQCPFKFKLRYIDRIKPDFKTSIEAHLGSVVHDTLEWMYIDKKNGVIHSVDEIITYYANKWHELYSEDILVVKRDFTVQDYFNKGVKFLLDYYLKHKPFDDGTLELERKIVLDLDGTGKYMIQGFIDRLVFNKETGKYEVHDYKTANSLPRPDKVASDRQLALYSIAVNDLFNTSDTLLVWHYLAHNRRITSERTLEQLEQLKRDIISLIDKIEVTKEFSACKSVLCGWCEFKSKCPNFGRQRTL